MKSEVCKTAGTALEEKAAAAAPALVTIMLIKL